MVNERTYSDKFKESKERKLKVMAVECPRMGVFWPFMSPKTEVKSSDLCRPTTNLCLYLLFL